MKYIKDERQNSILETVSSGYKNNIYYKRSCKTNKRENNPDTLTAKNWG